MLKTTTDFNVTLKVRESSFFEKYTSYQSLLNQMDWLSDQLNLYDCEVTTSLIKYDTTDGYGDVEDLGKSKYYLTINGHIQFNYQVQTLVHEFVHISQMKTGILRCHSNGDMVWRGKKFSYKDNGVMALNKKLIEYSEFPWEIDAMNREKDLLKKLKRF